MFHIQTPRSIATSPASPSLLVVTFLISLGGGKNFHRAKVARARLRERPAMVWHDVVLLSAIFLDLSPASCGLQDPQKSLRSALNTYVSRSRSRHKYERTSFPQLLRHDRPRISSKQTSELTVRNIESRPAPMKSGD